MEQYKIKGFTGVVCSRRCHQRYVKKKALEETKAAAAEKKARKKAGDENKSKKKRYHWHNDGNEASGGLNSIDVLLHWLQTEPNYARWRGGNNNGTTKLVMAAEIAGEM